MKAPSLTVPIGLSRGRIAVDRSLEDSALVLGVRTDGVIELDASSVIPFSTCLCDLQYFLCARLESISQSVWLQVRRRNTAMLKAQLFRPEVGLPVYEPM